MRANCNSAAHCQRDEFLAEQNRGEDAKRIVIIVECVETQEPGRCHGASGKHLALPDHFNFPSVI